MIILIAACEPVIVQSETSTPQNPLTTPTPLDGYVSDPSNPNNPLDSIGRLHNEGLIYIESKCSSTTFADKGQILDSVHMWTSAFVSKTEDQFPIVGATNPTELELLTYPKLVEELGQEGFSSEFFAIWDSAIQTVAGSPLYEVCGSILALENSLDFNSLHPDERIALYHFFSVLRYSSVYWESRFRDIDSPWWNQNGPLFNPRPTINGGIDPGDAKACLLADAFGAVKGGLIGSWGGSAGTLGGFLFGAVEASAEGLFCALLL